MDGARALVLVALGLAPGLQDDGALLERIPGAFPDGAAFEVASTDPRFHLETLRYASRGRATPAHLYGPVEPPDGPRPVVVVQSETTGDGGPAPELAALYHRLAIAGYLVVAPLLGGGQGEEDLHDLSSVVPLIRALPAGDATTLFLIGESRGGTRVLRALSKGFPARAGATWGALADAAPALEADAIEAPLLLLHGTAAPEVTVQRSEQLAARLAGRRWPCERVAVRGADQRLSRHTETRDALLLAWLERFSGRSPPVARTEYLGRRIAQTMHWSGAEWLLRETREEEEHVARFLEALAVQPGWTVADVGCGNGFHTLRLAEAVGPEGRVLAVDIQPRMLDLLLDRTEQAGLDNVRPILGAPHDPWLPPRSCDLVLMADVYHELAHPEAMLAALREALRPGGRLALLEFRAEDPDVPIKPLHRMARAQVRTELEANGFVEVASFDELPWQHLLWFARDDAPR
jgi:SAM-dependent methyltransferase/dienelactone hydrolase